MLCMPGANSRSSLIHFACIGVAPPRLYHVYIYINIKYVIVRLYDGNFGNLYHIHAKNPSQSHSVFSSVLASMCTYWVCVNNKPSMSKLHTPSYHINSLKLSRKFPLVLSYPEVWRSIDTQMNSIIFPMWLSWPDQSGTHWT